MKKKLIKLICGVLVYLCVAPMIRAQKDFDEGESFERQEIEKYLNVKRDNSITFDSENIKQFWISKNVSGVDDGIKIILEKQKDGSFRSSPYRIKFKNVDESMDCIIETGTDTLDLNLEFFGDNEKSISQTNSEIIFQNSKIVSSTIHLDDLSLTNNSINFVFSSKSKDSILLNKIVATFSKNTKSSFLFSPGTMNVLFNDVFLTDGAISALNNKLVLSGKRCLALTNKNIVSENKQSIKISAKVENKGAARAKIYIGFEIYSQEKRQLEGRNYPYSLDNEIIHIIEAKKGSNTIIVDKYPKWDKGCFIAFHAKDDLSDIPSLDISSGSIRDITKMDNGNAVITLSNAITSDYPSGTSVRIHGMRGSVLYTVKEYMNPGESKSYKTEITKDDSYLFFSQEALPHNVYYVKPVIGFVSNDSEIDSAIELSDYIVEY